MKGRFALDWWELTVTLFREEFLAGNFRKSLRLFKNVPAAGIRPDLDDFEAATFGGYEDKPQPDIGWTEPAIVDGGYEITSTPPEKWTVNANPHRITGWVLYDIADGAVYAWCVFDEPIEPKVGEDIEIEITVRFGECEPA